MSTRIIGLVSSYREGDLALGAIRSLNGAVDHTLLYEGPVGDAAEVGEPTTMPNFHASWITARYGQWASDADKRTVMVQTACHTWGGELWGLWLDGDEILFHGEYVRDYVNALRYEDGKGGMAIKSVEPDGSVGIRGERVMRLDLIERFVLGGYQVKLKGIETIVTLPMLPMSKREWWEPRSEDDRMFALPPVPGEPFIFHRSHLRHPDRRSLRLHESEVAWFEQATP